MMLAACDEAVAPPGRSADVNIRVYLDRDNSGSFTAADSGLAGVALTLAPTDAGSGTALAATSGANGVAAFAQVAPGAYTLTLPTTVPAGAVLTTTTAPRVVVSATGAVRADDVRYGWLPGTISGRIFRDDDGNGTFSTGDTPGAGLFAVLRRGSARLDSVLADEQGAFRFDFLAPGSYTVALENPATIAYADGASRTVSVAAGATASVNGVFTGALIIPIAEARARAVGATVAIVGNLTVRPGRFTSGSGGVNSEIWVQDATGGIAAFSVPTADSAQYRLGDQLEITGTRSVFSAQSQVTVTRVRNLGAGTPVVPVAQSASQANSLQRDGQLVRVPNLTVVNIPTGTGAAFTVLATDAAGDTLQLRIAGTGTGLSRASFTLGNRYNVTGILTRFNAIAQIKIRDTGDLEAGVPITPIGTVRTSGTNGTTYTVSGRISAAPGSFTSGSNNVNSELWVQDATGGIAVFSVPTADSTTLPVGALVEVTGSRSAFSGQLQLGTPTVVRTGAVAAITPVTVTAAQAAARTNEGQLVRLAGFTVTTVQTGTATAFTVTGTVDGVTLQVRVGGPLRGLSRSNFVVGNTYTVTGILTQFNGTAQIKPRSAADVTP
jgi:DNA/RNA endonuclease YhcR with UshA esterase domain